MPWPPLPQVLRLAPLPQGPQHQRDLQRQPLASIEHYLEVNNDDPTPYVWTATAESILAKVARGRATLEQVVSQS